MSLFRSVALLASMAAAQNITTSIWLPGAANANQSFIGSVVTQEGDRTTISVAFDVEGIQTEYYGNGPGYVTVEGTTYVAYHLTASDAGSDFTITVDVACSRKDGNGASTCAMTTRDATLEVSILDSYCGSQQGSTTNVFTRTDSPGPDNSDAPTRTWTITETVANVCTGSIDPSVFPQTTTTMSGDEQNLSNDYKLVITGGTEKLGASPTATPTRSGTQSTIALVSSGIGSAGVTQATGAAAPMLTMGPIVAGLGAAAAFFV